MTDPRLSTALRHLDLPEPTSTGWSWAVVDLEPAGRLHLPHDARTTLGVDHHTGPSSRRCRALDDSEIGELVNAVRTTSNNPDLDLLLVRFHLETGARRQGALNLRTADLDSRRATVWLREKNGDQREQPVSPALLTHLQRHAQARADGPSHPVFRTRSPTLSPGTLRPRSPAGTSTPPWPIAAAVAELTGEPHPLGTGRAPRRCARRSPLEDPAPPSAGQWP